jgi:hypothetical protein
MKGQGLIEEQSSKRYFLLVTLGIWLTYQCLPKDRTHTFELDSISVCSKLWRSWAWFSLMQSQLSPARRSLAKLSLHPHCLQQTNHHCDPALEYPQKPRGSILPERIAISSTGRWSSSEVYGLREVRRFGTITYSCYQHCPVISTGVLDKFDPNVNA